MKPGLCVPEEPLGGVDLIQTSQIVLSMDWREVLIIVMKEVPVTSAGCPEPLQLCWCLQVLGRPAGLSCRSLLTPSLPWQPSWGEILKGFVCRHCLQAASQRRLCGGRCRITAAVSIRGDFQSKDPVPLGECKPLSQGGAHEETFFSCAFC